MKFAEYIDHGWKLVPILPGHKGPRTRGWNERANCITDASVELHSAGLAHAYSGTCAIDIDDYAQAMDWFAERGVDLDELFSDATSVQIASGRANHGKLIYALPEPIVSKQIKIDKKCIVDFRCATSAGLTMQDVLPPSIHPDTGRPYEWRYVNDLVADWKELPSLPDVLRKIWLDEVQHIVEPLNTEAPAKGASLDELRQLLEHHDPDMSRDDWIRVGMAIHHETNGSMDGLMLWDEWSQRSTEKYNGLHELKVCWRSFHDTPNAVTVGALRQGASAAPEDFPEIEATPEDDDPWEAVAKEARERFEVIDMAEYSKRPPPEWLIEDVLPKADLAMIYGESGAGKSFVALDMACAVASGIDWAGNNIEAKPVVWVAAEAAGSMVIRSKAYGQAKGMELETIDLGIVGQTPMLMQTEDAVALTEAIKARKPGLVIIDTLAAASAGANENSGEDMNIVLGACRMLHEATGALVLLIHHTGKDLSKGARGWSGLRAAMHTEILVGFHQTMRKIEVTKQRDGHEGMAWPFRLMPVTVDMDGRTSCYVEVLDPALLGNEEAIIRGLGELQRFVLDCVLKLIKIDGSGVPVSEIHDEVLRTSPIKRRTANINRALSQLQSRGIIEIENNIVRLSSNEQAD